MNDILELKERVLSVCKLLPKLKLVTGTAGNVSARDPKSGLVAIKPSGLSYEKMSIDDIILLSINGEIIEKKHDLKSSFETPTHLEIFRRYPNVNGIIHTHSKFVNILSMVRDNIPCQTTPTGIRLLKNIIKVIPFINNGTQEMADVVALALKDSVAISIKNHGPFLVGETVELALERAIAIEDTSEIFYKASLLGDPSLIKIIE